MPYGEDPHRPPPEWGGRPNPDQGPGQEHHQMPDPNWHHQMPNPNWPHPGPDNPNWQRPPWWGQQPGHNQWETQNMSTISNITNILTAAGLTGSNLTSAISNIVSASPNAAIMTACQSIIANANNPAVVKDMAVKMAEIPNLPAGVSAMLPTLAQAQSPMDVINAVTAIERAVPSGFGSWV